MSNFFLKNILTQYFYLTYHFCEPGGGQLGKVLELDKELFPAQIQADQLRQGLLWLQQGLETVATLVENLIDDAFAYSSM